MSDLQIWCGENGSLNRIGDSYFGGNNHQNHNFKSYQNIGIKKMRLSCLWEEIAPKDLDHCQWKDMDLLLNAALRAQIEIIPCFLFHGSGPLYTSLIDPDFPQKFSTFARLFAERYPWVNDYVPIDDILQTAKSSCLNGKWYPHLTDSTYFLKALLHQAKAVTLAKREIRVINPKARFILSEEIGKHQGTNELKHKEIFENEKRWIVIDLLSGKIDKHHKLYSYFISSGIRPEELMWFEENAEKPDLLGIKHSHLSNRFFDHRVYLYDKDEIKKNHVNIPSIESGEARIISQDEIAEEAWNRFNVPITITEIHKQDYPESQMRWLNESWNTSLVLRSKGIPVEAVTVWNILEEKSQHLHEFITLCSPDQKPLKAGLSELIRDLVTKGFSNAPVLYSDIPWKTPRRIRWGAKFGEFTKLYHHSDSRPILIVNPTPDESQEFSKVCGARNIHFKIIQQKDNNQYDYDALEEMIAIFKPWAVVNAMGIQSSKIEKMCQDKKIKMTHFSPKKSWKDLTQSVNQCLSSLVNHEAKA